MVRCIEDGEAQAKQRPAAKARRHGKLGPIPERIGRPSIKSTLDARGPAAANVVANGDHVLDGKNELALVRIAKHKHDEGATANCAHRALNNTIALVPIRRGGFKNYPFLFQKRGPLVTNEAISIRAEVSEPERIFLILELRLQTLEDGEGKVLGLYLLRPNLPGKIINEQSEDGAAILAKPQIEM